jgi:hypothetical protein
MANTVIYVRDAKTGQLIPIKASDNGDGTYTATVLAAVINNEVVKNE